mgnify:CR=1 FL=1
MKKKIKVLHLTHTDIYDDNRILKELEALAVSGKYELLSVGVKDEGGGTRTANVVNAKVKLLTLVSKKFVYLPKFLRHGLNLFELFFPMLFCGIRYQPAIVHCHDTLVLPIGFLVSCLTGAKLVYDAHELESDKNGQSRLLSFATLLIEKICWPKVTTLISVSPSILSWYSAKLGYKRNTLILNAPFIPKDFKKSGIGNADSYFHRLYDIPTGELVFIYLGMLENGRGIRILLEAFTEQGINSHVVFVGHGSLAGEILTSAEKTNNVHLHKPVPHEEVVRLVKNADFGLCLVENISLSDFYCLPNKLFEYCFAGIPVLASKFPDIDDLVTKHGLGVVSQVDFNSVIKAIKELEYNPPYFSPNNIADLNWQTQAKRLLSAYSDIISEVQR